LDDKEGKTDVTEKSDGSFTDRPSGQPGLFSCAGRVRRLAALLVLLFSIASGLCPSFGEQEWTVFGPNIWGHAHEGIFGADCYRIH